MKQTNLIKLMKQKKKQPTDLIIGGGLFNKRFNNKRIQSGIALIKLSLCYCDIKAQKNEA